MIEQWAERTEYSVEQWSWALRTIEFLVGHDSAIKIIEHNLYFYSPGELVQAVQAMVACA